jgi:hypothetical protein
MVLRDQEVQCERRLRQPGKLGLATPLVIVR